MEDKPKTKETTEVAMVQPNEAATIEGFITQAIAEKLPIETMERFFALRKDVKAETAKEAFTIAMAGFQADCPVIEKTKEVHDKYGKLRYKYAPLDSIITQVKDALGKHKLAYDFSETREEKLLTVTCTVTHQLGHTKSSSFSVEIGTEQYMTDSQKYASRNTFAKRYAFCNVLGIVTGDEDTDAADENKKDKSKPADPKAQIVSLLRKLGTKDTSDAETTKAKILELTQLEPIEVNLEEIINRLEVLVEEKNHANT